MEVTRGNGNVHSRTCHTMTLTPTEMEAGDRRCSGRLFQLTRAAVWMSNLHPRVPLLFSARPGHYRADTGKGQKELPSLHRHVEIMLDRRCVRFFAVSRLLLLRCIIRWFRILSLCVCVCSALDEAKAAYRVWLEIRAKREEMLTEKQNKKPAPYKHVKVDICPPSV